MNFELRDDSPMYGRGFKRIPFEKIGLYEDERRASWPVAHKVRLVIIPPPTPVQKEEPKKADVPKVYNVPRRKAEITIDGNVTAAEWNGADKKKAMLLTQGIHGDEIGPKSYAWLAYDARTLYVAVANDVDSGKSLRKGNSWGQDDDVEVALRNKAAGATAPIFVLRGFPSGHFLSSDEAGAPAKAVKKAGDAVKYAAKIAGKDKWSAEYAIPFAALVSVLIVAFTSTPKALSMLLMPSHIDAPLMIP